ncbi:MAG: glycosyltransferase, partial [Acidimicrobiales bacterium]|nr:glycosyltransferase [Acidimicrobiales bacterium]
MRVLIVSDTLAGGMGTLARAHAAFLVGRGWEVCLAAPADGSVPTPPARFATLPVVSSLRRVGQMRAARAALRAVWRDFGAPDTVVHAHGMRAFLLCRVAGLPKPYVSVHGAHPSDDDPLGYDRLRRAWFGLLPRLSRGATSGEPTDVPGWTYSPFASPLLAKVDRLPFPPADSEPVIAWLGLLDDRKQPDVFV